MEDILEPDLPICDSHHHLWDREKEGRYLAAEYLADARSGHNVQKSIECECQLALRKGGPEAFRSIGETEFIVNNEPSGFIAGIVGFADLRLPEAGDVLDAHIEAGKGRFRGIRHSIAFDPYLPTTRVMPSDLLDDPAFHRGFSLLRGRGLTFDGWLYHHQISAFAELGRKHPDVQMILEHAGTPLGVGPYAGYKEEVMEVWRAGMRAVASVPNIALQLGGIGQRRLGVDWGEDPKAVTSEQIAAVFGDQFRFCIELIGPDRCMFESNFPGDGVAFTYPVLWNAYKRITADLSRSERELLFCGTASKVYGV